MCVVAKEYSYKSLLESDRPGWTKLCNRHRSYHSDVSLQRAEWAEDAV